MPEFHSTLRSWLETASSKEIGLVFRSAVGWKISRHLAHSTSNIAAQTLFKPFQPSAD